MWFGNTEPWFESWDGESAHTTVRVLKGPIAWVGLGGRTDFVSDGLGDNRTMAWHDTYSYGVKIEASFGGHIGTPSASAFVEAIISVIVLIGCAKVLADVMAQFIVKDRKVYFNSKNDFR